MIRLTAFFLVLVLGLSLSVPTLADDDISIMVDFDGSGGGQLYTSGPIPDAAGTCSDCVATNHSTYDVIGSQSTAISLAQARAFEERRRVEQQRSEAQQRLSLLTQLDKLNALSDPNADSADKQARLEIKALERITDALPSFLEQSASDLEFCGAIERHMQQRFGSAKRTSSRQYKSLLMLGFNTSPQDAQALQHTVNPFSGDPYSRVVAFGSHAIPSEISRVLVDHFRRSCGALSGLTASNLGDIRDGIVVTELVAHSNGASIAEALIRAGFITGVKRLRILGGDGSLMNLTSLQELQDRFHMHIYVYAIRGDPIPMLPRGWSIRDWAEILVDPPTRYQNEDDPIYSVLDLRRHHFDPNSSVQVQLLSFPSGLSSNIMYPHFYQNYAAIINSQRMMGCLTASSSQRCIVHR
jgi:hypothetical protein